ncbi:hypothetical protein JCM10908_004546 [Rhodotorula pacifica]|uniref:Zn(II)2Cys6 transcription factor n=1 Tax=Rhodotorula pacifica TaxID=1495444 RepID=UPI0031722C37
MGKRSRGRQEDADYSPVLSGAGTAKASGSTERRAGRGAVACLQCRSRKSVCSLSGPACDGCLHRGEGDACSFQALIWIDNIDDLPSRQLKRKVDRLEALLNLLQTATKEAPRAPPPPPPIEAPAPVRAASAPPITSTEEGFRVLPAPFRARVQDCDSLVRILLSDTEILSLSSLNIDAKSLAAQLRRDEQEHEPGLAILHAPHPSALYVPISAEEYHRDVEGVLPTLAQAQLTLTAYFSLSNGFLRLIHPATFLAQCDQYWRTRETPEPNWLATYLIVCAYGLLAAPDADNSAHSMLPVGPGKEMLARTWFDAARRVLAANNFMTKQSVEGLRAFALLVQWWMSEGARYAEAALSVSVAVVSSAFDLQLNRDPTEIDPSLPPHLAEIRRRIFWTIYVFEAMVRPMLGKFWRPFDEDDITVRMPGMDEPGSPTAYYQAASLNSKVSTLMTRPKVATPTVVSTLFDDLEIFLDANGANPLAIAMARFSYYRLHRFATLSGMSTDQREANATRVFESLLDSIRNASSMPNCPAIVLLRAFSAAIAAAADLSDLSYAQVCSTPVGIQLHRLLADLPRLAFPPNHLRLVRRATLILRSLLSTAERSFPRDQGVYSEEASDFSVGSSSIATPVTATGLVDSHGPVYPLSNGFVATEHYETPHAESLPPPTPVYGRINRHYSLQHDPQSFSREPSFPIPRSAPAHQAAFVRQDPQLAGRPALSLFTTVAYPPTSQKAPTPLVSPWIDAAITPSRYVDGRPWDRYA